MTALDHTSTITMSNSVRRRSGFSDSGRGKLRAAAMSSALKEMPTFNTEDEEREFWSNADSTEYIDWSKAKEHAFPRLRPTAPPTEE
jgi:hypothetical protein